MYEREPVRQNDISKSKFNFLFAASFQHYLRSICYASSQNKSAIESYENRRLLKIQAA